MDTNDEFRLPFSEMESIKATTEIMKSFEAMYIQEANRLEAFVLPEKPFGPEKTMSRTEAFPHVQRLIDILQATFEPYLLDMECLPTIDDFEREEIFKEIGEQQNISSREQTDAMRLWTEIHCEYIVKRHRASRWREDWCSHLTNLVDGYYVTFGELNEQEQELFLRAFKIANPEKSVLIWIAMMGPRDSSVHGLAYSPIPSIE